MLWPHRDLEALEESCLSWRMGREGCGNGLLSAESGNGEAGKAAHPSIPRRVGWRQHESTCSAALAVLVTRVMGTGVLVVLGTGAMGTMWQVLS